MSTRQQQEDEAYEIDQACLHLDKESPVLHVCLACYRAAQATAEARRDALWRETLRQAYAGGPTNEADTRSAPLRALLGAAEPKAPPSLAALVEQQEGQQGAAAPVERLRGWFCPECPLVVRTAVGKKCPQCGAELLTPASWRKMLNDLLAAQRTGRRCEIFGRDAALKADLADREVPATTVDVWKHHAAQMAWILRAASVQPAAALATSREGRDLLDRAAGLVLAMEEEVQDEESFSLGSMLFELASRIRALDRAAQEQQGGAATRDTSNTEER